MIPISKKYILYKYIDFYSYRNSPLYIYIK
jgi:hypothetical protein